MLVAPRVGKTRIMLGLLAPTDKVLVLYPSLPNKKSWTDEVKLLGVDVNITYSTYISAKKYLEEKWDWVIMDEIHKASKRQWEFILKLQARRKFAMSGTIKYATRYKLLENHFPIIIEYPISKAIEDGVITDIKVTLVKVKPESRKKYDKLTHIIDDLMYDYTQEGRQVFKYLNEADKRKLKFLSLERMRSLHRDPAKIRAVKHLLKEFNDKRLLLFSSETKLLDQLDIPAYHSKNPDEQLKNDFCSGKGLKLGVLKMFNQGVTVVPINLCIIHNFSSNPEDLAQQINRITAFEYNNVDKLARVYIVILEGTQEEKWAEKALEFIPSEKIRTYNL